VLRVVLINKSQTATRTVKIALPAGSATTATVERMAAPSVASRQGVTLGGHGYGAATATGRLPAPRLTVVAAADHRVTVSVPHASAALVTFGRAAAG
jgi:hypothetical protein